MHVQPWKPALARSRVRAGFFLLSLLSRSGCGAFESADVAPILRAPRRTLVRKEVVPTDERHAGSANIHRAFSEPEIDVLRRARSCVQRHGVSPDDEEPHAAFDERRKHLDQIAGEAHRGAAGSRG